MSWSLLGKHEKAGRSGYFGLAYAVIVASEAFVAHPDGYKKWMAVLILVAGLFIGKKALNAKSILGLATTVLSLVWIAPLISSSVFKTVDLSFMLAHSALALAVAVGAYTYLKN